MVTNGDEQKPQKRPELGEEPLTMEQIERVSLAFSARMPKSYAIDAANIMFLQSDAFDRLWRELQKERKRFEG